MAGGVLNTPLLHLELQALRQFRDGEAERIGQFLKAAEGQVRAPVLKARQEGSFQPGPSDRPISAYRSTVVFHSLSLPSFNISLFQTLWPIVASGGPLFAPRTPVSRLSMSATRSGCIGSVKAGFRP